MVCLMALSGAGAVVDTEAGKKTLKLPGQLPLERRHSCSGNRDATAAPLPAHETGVGGSTAGPSG